MSPLCLFRAVWRFSQDLVSFWGHRSEVGPTSHLDTKSLFCFLDVYCWLWFLSTYTSCHPSVSVGDFSVWFVHFQSFQSLSDCNLELYFVLLFRSDANPSKDSFFRLLTKVKIILICYVIFTLSAGLGFLDATLSLFAIETVISLCSDKPWTVKRKIFMWTVFVWSSLVSRLATWDSSCLACPCRTVWPHLWSGILLINIPWVSKHMWITYLCRSLAF